MKLSTAPKSTQSGNKYWVNDDPDKRVTHLEQQITGNSGLYAQIYRNVNAYYSNQFGKYDINSSLSFMGDQGELVRVVVNQARNLVRQYIAILTKGRMAVQAHARNTDGNSLNAGRLCTALAEQIIADMNLEAIRSQIAEYDAISGLGFVRVGWGLAKGDDYVNDQGNIAKRGALEITHHTLFDVLWDTTQTQFEDSQWVRVRVKKNRWDLIAQHPDLEDLIAKAPSYYTDSQTERVYSDTGTASFNEDTVALNVFYHKTTLAVPNGCYMEYLSEDCILVDDKNPWMDKIPVSCVRTQPIINSCYGYAMFNDLAPLQEMLDHNFSVISTNQTGFGVQAILNPRGSNVTVEQIKGRAFINYTPQNANGGGKPEPLQLTQTAPEIFKFADTLRSHLMELSNINGALRGTPPPGVTAGTAIATLTTNAIEFVTMSQREIDACMERVLNYAIQTYQVFASTPQMLRMVGKAKQFVVKQFSSDDLKEFERVIIRPINPLMVSQAGRSQMAETMIKSGFINSPQDLLLVLTTGNLELLYEDEVNKEIQVRRNCEELLDGKMPPVLAGQDHAQNMYKAFALIDDPEVARNSTLVSGIMNFIQQHYQLLKTADPVLQSILNTGKVPPPPAPPNAPPPGAPQGGPQ